MARSVATAVPLISWIDDLKVNRLERSLPAEFPLIDPAEADFDPTLAQ